MDSSLGKKEEIVDSLGKSQVCWTVLTGSKNWHTNVYHLLQKILSNSIMSFEHLISDHKNSQPIQKNSACCLGGNEIFSSVFFLHDCFFFTK